MLLLLTLTYELNNTGLVLLAGGFRMIPPNSSLPGEISHLWEELVRIEAGDKTPMVFESINVGLWY